MDTVKVTEDLSALVIDANEKRRRYKAAEEAIEKEREALFNHINELSLKWDQEHAPLLLDLEQKEAQADNAETLLRARAIEHFKAHGDKSPTKGVNIAETSRIEYAENVAIAWAKEHGHTELIAEKIDKKKFGNLAKALDIDFVRTITIPSVRITWNKDD